MMAQCSVATPGLSTLADSHAGKLAQSNPIHPQEPVGFGPISGGWRFRLEFPRLKPMDGPFRSPGCSTSQG